jgi:AbrB family looped-hinge helix DNA binding protein
MQACIDDVLSPLNYTYFIQISIYYLQSMNANAKVTEDNKVKITGLTRRVDSLGRIVISKELRRMLHIKEGSPLEIYMDADETIVLRKYSQVGSLKNISQAYAQSLSKVTGATVCVADRDEIIAAAVILCAYAEQGDKLESVEKLVSAAAEFPARQLG